MLRTVLAVLAGYVATVLIVVAFFFVVVASQGLDPEQVPPTNILVVSIFVSLIAAIIGGLTTACLAQKDPFQHAVYLIVVGLAMGLVSMAMGQGREPFWYQLAIQIVMVVGILIGGQWITIRQEKKRRKH